MLGFESGIDDGTDEGIEAVVMLIIAGFGVNRSVRRGMLELRVEAFLPIGSERVVMEFGISLLAGLSPAVMMREFVAGSRRFGPVPRMADGICLRCSFENNSTAVIAE